MKKKDRIPYVESKKTALVYAICEATSGSGRGMYMIQRSILDWQPLKIRLDLGSAINEFFEEEVGRLKRSTVQYTIVRLYRCFLQMEKIRRNLGIPLELKKEALAFDWCERLLLKDNDLFPTFYTTTQ